MTRTTDQVEANENDGRVHLMDVDYHGLSFYIQFTIQWNQFVHLLMYTSREQWFVVVIQWSNGIYSNWELHR